MSLTASHRRIGGDVGIPETLTASSPRLPVPNHLVDSQTFSKVAKNEVVVASPAVVHFGGFVVGKTSLQKLDLVNCSSDVQRYHILPPQTRFFKIKYTKGDRLIPGLALRLEISFLGDEWRYYYDCIRVHCRGAENLVIPIHAYPTLDDGGVPKTFTFPPTPIGVQHTKVVPLRSPHPVSFEFRVSILEGNPAFAVQPMEGVVPPKGDARINVIFTPIAFVTASMKMIIETSQFNSKPHVCVFAGTCRPGMGVDGLGGGVGGRGKKTLSGTLPSTLDPHEIKPLDVARKRKQLLKLTKVSFHGNRTGVESESSASEYEREGVMFPKDLDNPQAISYVLNQRPGAMTTKQLRDVISQASTRKKSAKASRARKEALFVGKTNDLQAEERANQLRWMTKLGEEAMSSSSKEEVTEDRQAGLEMYKQKRGDPLAEEEVARNSSHTKFKRIERGLIRPDEALRRLNVGSPSGQDDATTDPDFDHYNNDPWILKNRALFLFNQAARKVLIQNRADRNLAKMRRFKEAWKAGRWSVENVTVTTTAPDGADADEELSTPPVTAGGLEMAIGEGFLVNEDERNKENEEVIITDLEDEEKATEILKTKVDRLAPSVFNEDVIRTSSFPEYVAPDFVDDMAGEALGYVPYRISEVLVQSQTPYFNLKVPQQYRIQSYSRHSSQEAASNYVAPQRRQLRSGAEEEIAAAVTPIKPELQSTEADSIPVEAKTKRAEDEVIKMPEFLGDFRFPPVEVFNPAPGLVRYRKHLPYAETDLDFHLNPIPPHVCRHDSSTASPHCATQRHFLHPDDVIPEVMTWKKYWRHGLSATIQTPTISSVWVPRWTDPYVEDMVPQAGPAMMDPPETAAKDGKDTVKPTETVDANHGIPKISTEEITFDSVLSQFHLVSENEIAPAPSMLFDSQLHLASGASGAPGDTSQMGGAAGASQIEATDSGANFPFSRSLPKTYIPVASSGGMISRDQRMKELNIFVLSKYNQLGRRVNEHQETMNGLLTDPSLKLVKPKTKQKDKEDDEDMDDVMKPSGGAETPSLNPGAASRTSFHS